jgi:hypothetical protein
VNAWWWIARLSRRTAAASRRRPDRSELIASGRFSSGSVTDDTLDVCGNFLSDLQRSLPPRHDDGLAATDHDGPAVPVAEADDLDSR